MTTAKITPDNAEHLDRHQLRRLRGGSMRTFIVPAIVLTMRKHENGAWHVVSRSVRSDDLADLPSVEVLDPFEAVR